MLPADPEAQVHCLNRVFLFARQRIYLSAILIECWQLRLSASSGPFPATTFFHYACSDALPFNACSEHLHCPYLPVGSSNLNSSSNKKKISTKALQPEAAAE